VPADYLRDVSELNALIGDAVISTTRGTLFKRQLVKMRSIEPVQGGPVIEPVTDIRGNALFTRNGKEAGTKP
jgi:hypothetical protein